MIAVIQSGRGTDVETQRVALRCPPVKGAETIRTLQQAEFASEAHGYTATRHQRAVGTGYFDDVTNVIAAGQASTAALEGSTESAQF